MFFLHVRPKNVRRILLILLTLLCPAQRFLAWRIRSFVQHFEARAVVHGFLKAPPNHNADRMIARPQPPRKRDRPRRPRGRSGIVPDPVVLAFRVGDFDAKRLERLTPVHRIKTNVLGWVPGLIVEVLTKRGLGSG